MIIWSLIIISVKMIIISDKMIIISDVADQRLIDLCWLMMKTDHHHNWCYWWCHHVEWGDDQRYNWNWWSSIKLSLMIILIRYSGGAKDHICTGGLKGSPSEKRDSGKETGKQWKCAKNTKTKQKHKNRQKEGLRETVKQ